MQAEASFARFQISKYPPPSNGHILARATTTSHLINTSSLREYQSIGTEGVETEIDMDFHKLTRRDLQALCKKNQIPANGTNIVMADRLASLQHVEGLDEFLKHDVTQFPDTEKPPTPVITRSMARASTRRRTIMEPETELLPSYTTARLTMRNRNATAAAADKERKVLNFIETPAVSWTEKRTEFASVQLKEVKEKVEGEKNEDGYVHVDGTVNTVEKTRPGKTRASVTQSTRMYTRRSTRLLEKKMNDLKLSDEVTMDLEPMKISGLAAEKDLTKDFEDAIEDEHPSESVKEDSKAEIVACEVEELAKVASKIEAERESESAEISKISESKAAESEVDAPVEVESDSKTKGSQVIANIQDEKIDELDESVGQLQEGRTSSEEDADGNGYRELTVPVDPTNGDDISVLTVQVTSLNLHSLKIDCIKDMDSGEVEKTAVPDDNDVIILKGYLGDSDESTLKVESLNGDDKLKIYGDALSEQPNNPIANSATKMELCNNIGQLFDEDVTGSELAMESPQNQKSAEIVDVQIFNGACEIVKDSDLISTGDSEVDLLKEDIFSKKANKVRLSALSVIRLTELPTPLKDESKENIRGVEFRKTIIGLPVADEGIRAPTPLNEKSLGQLKKLLKNKFQVQNDKRLALQNNSMAVTGEKDD